MALTSANFSGDANDINLAIQKQDTITIQDEANSILSSWKNLSTDPAQARRGILSMAPSDFAQNYILGTTKDLDSSYVNRYWHRLAVTGLTVLARAGQADISNSLNQLKQYRRFPLAPEDAKVPDLSQQDVGAARTLLTKILGDVPAANNGSTPARTIAQGGTTRDKDVDTQLDLLRGTALLQGYTKYFDQLTKMLNALPPGQQTYTATLTVAKDKMKGQSSIADRYSYMQINLGADKLTQLQFANTNVVDSVGVTYPATGDLTFALSEILNGPVVQTETIQGPWSPLRLLKSDNVKSISRDGKKWVIEYIVTDAAKKTYPLWLTLEFKAEVPDLTDWPTPPAN
mgnify:FL=1